MNAAHATWQFANEMKPGDVVFAKKGMHQLLGRGVVASDYMFDAKRSDKYKNLRKVKWTHNGEWQHPGQAVQKTLTDITQYSEYVEKLNALFDEDVSEDDSKDILYPPYSIEDFLDEVYMDEVDYRNLVSLIANKKNVILQGAPGVGKTYVAKRLAYSIMGEKNRERVLMIQFHQSYSYEDFIMGFRPSENGFELRKGAFYNFCKDAEIDSENEYFFIIDEINRGNLSKIFGELFMLIENDKRGIELQLLYADEKFAVPDNVYIIGMMNTADRSLAMLDYALRRRFAFYDIKPGFNSEGFRAYRMALASDKFDRLINCIENLNNTISADESLGEGFRIGHSYFCNFDEIDDQALIRIVEYELIPLLKEYWFDEPIKVKDWSNNLRSAIK
jgi:5-methylcytosine-specific restriction protein B